MSKAKQTDKIRPGDIRVVMEDETIIWMDRKRITVLALPWTFTEYVLTASRLVISSGFLNQKEEEIRLYRIKDISWSQSLYERIENTGSLRIISNDATVPEIKLLHIKNARKVKDVISQAVEVSRRANGVRTSELIGGGPVHSANQAEHESGALGPEIVPDFDGDGVDDRLD